MTPEKNFCLYAIGVLQALLEDKDPNYDLAKDLILSRAENLNIKRVLAFDMEGKHRL